MVVQLLIFYYVLLPIFGVQITRVQVSMVVFGLNSGAYISEIMRSGIQSVDPGQMEAGTSSRTQFWNEYDEDCDSAGCKEHSSDTWK